jgi:hypothetical protein
LPRASEVYTQRREPGIIQAARGAEDHLIVHRPAVQRVRVKDERGPAALARRLLKNGLDAPVRRG